MFLNRARAEAVERSAVIIDFNAAKIRHEGQRMTLAERDAAAALARFDAGHCSWSEVMAALVGPFNR
jgi:hypothetical protein